ncbi:MAG: bifunctional diaminohydroxyphosphoribosylaminopyrimidine deaminase/5-amino-6-(5-phosphoribosylamino)uracil reductase RibD [Candidatus Eremiobacteraeota bacterium]|nr:bifunctional diaminohydroxyphosphoribosylaminopyrimidine deaminase/5-amino-6-(5-phosphoribosylamino)uracil reductase RibD [Candidatus Eremiobacteraeota bacterium]
MPADLTPVDRLFLERACELAARGIGSTAPNPPVGAVIVRDGRILGEGFHHKAGLAHAETNALEAAGDVRGATVYVSLEPCDHVGRTPACSQSLIDAGVARVVAGALDPNPRTNGRGIARLRSAGIDAMVVDDARSLHLIEPFAYAVRHNRPYAALKMAMSLDGFITSKPGVQQWITSEDERLYVRDLRIGYDAVMVGAGTVRVDDPQLTVRPEAHRLRPFTRVVACETDTVPASSRVFAPAEDYAKTVVLAPAGARKRFGNLASVADLLFVGGPSDAHLDLSEAMRALRTHGIQSVLCEGGPTLGARLIRSGVVDRFYWAIAPVLLGNALAVPVLSSADATPGVRLRFERSECVGEDVVVSGRFEYV